MPKSTSLKMLLLPRSVEIVGPTSQEGTTTMFRQTNLARNTQSGAQSTDPAVAVRLRSTKIFDRLVKCVPLSRRRTAKWHWASHRATESTAHNRCGAVDPKTADRM